MPKWKDNVIFLSSKPYGEIGMVASVFSSKNGRYKGWVHGGNSTKMRAVFQQGNLCSAEWKARISEQMGSFKLELIKSTAPTLMYNPIQLSALSSICEISDYILPEREPNPVLFEATIKLFDLLKISNAENILWVKGYIKWEIGLLSELGFSLKLNNCAVTGKKQDLAFVSPKTGRAVSYDVGLPYKNKLINLPRFLGGSRDRNKDSDLKDLIQGLQLTKFFLELNFFKDKPFPHSRLRFTKLLEDKLYKGHLNDKR